MHKNIRMRWPGLLVAGALATLLSGCGGGGDAQPATTDTTTTPPSTSLGVNVGDNKTTPTEAQKAAWAALTPQVSVQSVVINSPPVVTFRVTDANGAPVLGLGNTSKSATATAATLTNLAFSLAKLVPGTNGSPSKWVSYMVTTVPTTTAAAAPTRPSTDTAGTLESLGDGNYKYTFYRDVTKVKDQVAGMTVTGTNNKADLGDLTYDPSLVHRLTIQVAGSAPGTGKNTPTGADSGITAVAMVRPTDLIYDFIPATGKPATAADPNRDIVANAKCEECHRKLGGLAGDSANSSSASFHGGSRNNVQYCVVCHTDQFRYGRTQTSFNTGTWAFAATSQTIVDGRALGDLPNLIHKIHNGKLLSKPGYNFAGVTFNDVGYPQDIRNCTKCHDGSDTSSAKTAAGNNWMSKPSRLACGACHDGLDFTTGYGVTLAAAADARANGTTPTPKLIHTLKPVQNDDSACSNCHDSASVDLVHTPVTPPNRANALIDHTTDGLTANSNTNAAWIASNTSRLPTGAIKVSYDIKSVTAVANGVGSCAATGTNKCPQMVFRLLQNGARKDLNVLASATVNAASGQKEIWDNFMGAPSVYFVYAVAQDGVATPADFNVSASGWIKSMWNAQKASPTAAANTGTLTGPDADGYYTATLTAVQVPSTAVMLTGGVGYTYTVTSTLPLTQTNLADYPVPIPGVVAAAGQTNKTGGLIVIAPNAQKVADGYTGRRAIVDDKKCNNCHQELGTFTEDAFHAGQRNDGSTCAWCHKPNQTSSGWSADSASFVHGIHAGAMRTKPFTWHASSTSESFADVGYPGVLRDCETCHVPGSYDFSATASAAALPNRLPRTVGTGTYASSSSALALYSMSPYIAKDVSYGSGFSFNTATAATTAAAPTTLVMSPIATACFSCHDSETVAAGKTFSAKQHMLAQGAALYEARSTALTRTETCLTCHGTTSSSGIKAVHAK